MWIRTKRYGVATGAGSSSGGSGSPGGASGAIQYNNAGAFGGVGSLSGTGITFPLESITLESGKQTAFTYQFAGGANFLGNVTRNILFGPLATIANNTTFTIEMVVSTIRNDAGQEGTSGFAYKINATFRKGNAGALTRIGAATIEWTKNDTGDAFATQDLYVSGANILIETVLATAKSFVPLGYVLTATMNEI